MGGGILLYFPFSPYTVPTFVRNMSTSLLAHARSGYCLKQKYYTFERRSVVIPTWNSISQDQGVIFWAKLLWPCCAMPQLVEGLCVVTATWPQHDKLDGCIVGKYLVKSAQNPHFYTIRTRMTDFTTVSTSSDSLMEWRFSLWRRRRQIFNCGLNSFALAQDPSRSPKLLARCQCRKWNTVSRMDRHWEKRLFKNLSLCLVLVSGRRNRNLPYLISRSDGLTLSAVYHHSYQLSKHHTSFLLTSHAKIGLLRKNFHFIKEGHGDPFWRHVDPVLGCGPQIKNPWGEGSRRLSRPYQINSCSLCTAHTALWLVRPVLEEQYPPIFYATSASGPARTKRLITHMLNYSKTYSKWWPEYSKHLCIVNPSIKRNTVFWEIS